MKRRFPALVVAVLLCCGAASAQQHLEQLPAGYPLREADQAQPLSLADLERQVWAHPAVGREAALVAAAQGRQFQAGRYPNPDVAYDASDLGADGSPGTHGFYVEQEVVTAGKLRLDQSTAAWETVRQQREAEAELLAVLHDVRRSWVTLLALSAERQLAQEAVSLAEQLQKKTAEIQEDDGDEAAQPDVIIATIRLRRLRLAQYSIEARWSAGWQQLGAIAGLPGLRPAPMRESLEVCLLWTHDAELLWQYVAANSAQLHEARADVARARLAHQRQCAEVVPNLAVRVGAEYDFQADQPQGLFRVSVPLRLHDRNTGNILAAQAEIRAAQLEVDRLELELRRRLAQAVGQIEEYSAIVREYHEHVLPQAQRAARRYFEKFADEDASYSDAESAQDNYLNRRREYIEALLAVRRAEVAIISQLPEARPGLRLGE